MEMLGAGFQRLEATLIAREKMQGVLTSNIANADTPNFKADHRSFDDFLAAQQGIGQTDTVATTNPMHFADINSDAHLAPSLVHQGSSNKMDGNDVDIQQEMARMSENQLMYELSMRLIKGRLGGLLNAIKEGSR